MLIEDDQQEGLGTPPSVSTQSTVVVHVTVLLCGVQYNVSVASDISRKWLVT